MDDVAREIVSRVEKLQADRSTWESHWDEVARYVWPSYSGIFLDRGLSRTQGEKRTEYQFDATASVALQRFAASMESMLTPRQGKWHHLRPSDPYLMKNRDTKLWFEDVNNILFRYRYAPKANFTSQMGEVYLGLGAFGTGAMFIDDLKVDGRSDGLRYKAVHLGEMLFSENHQGIIDTAYRRFVMTSRQMAQKWGDKVPKEILDTVDQKPDEENEIIHCVRPNESKDSTKIDYRGMDFQSIYVAVKGNVVLQVSGYEEFPYPLSRYTTTPGEIYGRSPAMMVLPSIKVLNEQKKTVLKQGHRAVDPVLLAYDDGVLDSFSLKPGAINYGGVSAEGRALVQALPTGDFQVAKEMMQDERLVINDAFLVTLFQILIDTPQMTATEVMERAREKGALLAPTMGRQQSEMLGPMIERELGILARQRKLPPMPQALKEAQGEYKIEYDSPLSRAQKAEEGAGTMRMIQWSAEIAANAQNPAVFDHFNFDEIIPALAEINAMPTSFINDVNTIKAIRDGRQQQMATQQLIDAAPSMAAMMKQGVGAPA
jgi:hypothetical protein